MFIAFDLLSEANKVKARKVFNPAGRQGMWASITSWAFKVDNGSVDVNHRFIEPAYSLDGLTKNPEVWKSVIQ